MKVCQHCKHENIEGALVCANCNKPLGGKKIRTGGTTHHLEDEIESINFPRWGTARLGEERKLLFHVRGYDEPLVVPVSSEVILGRLNIDTGEAPEVDLTPYNAQANGVSREHAAILIEDDALKVMDLASANYTYMNGQKLIAHQARILRDGDELRLGRLVIRINFA